MNKSDRFTKLTTDRHNMFYWQTDRPFSEEETKKIFLDRHQNFDTKKAIEAIEYGMKKKVAKLHNIIAFGSVNVVLKATLENKIDVVFRIHPPGVKNGYFWAESVAAEQAKKAGVPSYKTYVIDDSQRRFNFDYMIIESLPGDNLHKEWPLEKEREQKLMEETGYYLAKIHGVKTENFGFFDNAIAKEQKRLDGIHKQWKDHIFAALNPNLDYLTKNSVIASADRKKIETILLKNEKLLHFDDPRLIQNDLADWNELVKDDHITGIIDWDEAYSGDPIADFSAWTVFFPYERMEALKKGYLKFSPLPDGFEEKLHLYRIRYIVSKATLRAKKTLHYKVERYQKMLDFALKILGDEFSWYGM